MMRDVRAMSGLILRGVEHAYGSAPSLRGVSLNAAPGEIVCLYGPSGCGKTTLLRIIAGLERASAGEVSLDGAILAGGAVHVAPERRPIGIVFQEFALFPHMTARENIAFGVADIPLAERSARADEALAGVDLAALATRYPHEMSGGQQQRVALARSLVLEPKILLLDEPFASLDQHLRERLREEVRDIQQRLKITTLFVTHGQDEALALSDRIVVLRDGRTEQIDRPDTLYREPATPFVAGFIGSMNLIDGTIANGRFSHAAYTVPVPVPDGPAQLAVRPEALDIVPATGKGEAKIHRVTDFGTHAIVDIELPDGFRMKSMVSDARQWKAEQPIDLKAKSFAAFRDNVAIYRSA